MGRTAGPELSLFRADETLYLGAYSGAPIGQTCELTLTDADRGRCNGLGFSRLKDVFVQNFRAEIDTAFRALSKTVLEPAAVSALIDQGAALFSEEDWNASPASKSFCGPDANQLCVFADQVAAMKQWAINRNSLLVQRLGN